MALHIPDMLASTIHQNRKIKVYGQAPDVDTIVNEEETEKEEKEDDRRDK